MMKKVLLSLITVLTVSACGGGSDSAPPLVIVTPPPVVVVDPIVECISSGDIAIELASDDGTNDGNIPANAIDGNLLTRWSSEGIGKTIVFDLAQQFILEGLSVAWHEAVNRIAFFEVESSSDNSNWTSILSNASSMNSTGFELYDIADSTERYLRIIGGGNSVNNGNSILDVKIHGCNTDGSLPPAPTQISNLDPSLPPSGNFELIDWKLQHHLDEDGNGRSDQVDEEDLANGYENPDFFYTASDGGMVFKVPIAGAKTSTNTSYTRTELREMLREGNRSFSTSGVGKNNWVFGSAPESDQAAAGGIDGVLTGTLAVNHVTTTGADNQVGRVIFAQIHANDDEPIRFYYRKLPNNTNASIYFAHESRNVANDIYFEMIGSRSQSQSNPVDGIALNEKFSYEIRTVGNQLTVKLIRSGKADIVETVDMSSSGYDVGGQYMYFKAGAYIQDNTGDDDDYAQVTYYALSNEHN